MFRSFLREKGCNISRWACGTLPHPCQQDVTSSVVFALKFAECVLKESIIFSNTDKDVNIMREEIAVTLLQNTDDLSQLCHFCEEVDNNEEDTNWIGCYCCPRWFHQSCMKTIRSLEDYVCAACQD